MPILDILIFIIILSYALAGLVRGFLKTSVQLGITIISLGIAILLAPTLCLLFTDVLHIDTQLASTFANTLNPYCISSTGGALDNAVLHQFAQLTLGHDYWLNYVGGVENAEFIALLSYAVAKNILVLISFLIIFAFLRIILGLICSFIRAINRKRVYGWIARSFGAILGLIEAIITILLILSIIYIFSPTAPSFGTEFVKILSNNPITEWIYNLVADLLNGIILPWTLGI